MKKQSEDELKNKTQKTAMSGSSEEKSNEISVDSSSKKSANTEVAWDIEPEETENFFASDDIESLIQKIENAGSKDPVDMKEVEEALQKILDADWGDEAMKELAPAIPVHILNLGKDQDYLFSVQRKTFVAVKNKLEVIPIESPPSLKGSGNFYLIGNEVFDIDKEKVICVGWN